MFILIKNFTLLMFLIFKIFDFLSNRSVIRSFYCIKIIDGLRTYVPSLTFNVFI